MFILFVKLPYSSMTFFLLMYSSWILINAEICIPPLPWGYRIVSSHPLPSSPELTFSLSHTLPPRLCLLAPTIQSPLLQFWLFSSIIYWNHMVWNLWDWPLWAIPGSCLHPLLVPFYGWSSTPQHTGTGPSSLWVHSVFSDSPAPLKCMTPAWILVVLSRVLTDMCRMMRNWSCLSAHILSGGRTGDTSSLVSALSL